MKRIRILTGGGDAPGLNAVTRAVVKTAVFEYGCDVLGIRNGYDGFIDEKGVIPLGIESVRGLLPRGGSSFGGAGGFDRMVALRNAQVADISLEEALVIPKRVNVNGDAVLTACNMGISFGDERFPSSFGRGVRLNQDAAQKWAASVARCGFLSLT
jgi:hypothetical protein